MLNYCVLSPCVLTTICCIAVAQPQYRITNIVARTTINDDDANKAAAQLQAVVARNPDLSGVFGANLFSAIGVKFSSNINTQFDFLLPLPTLPRN